MKKVKVLYQERCPFCKMVFRFIDELKQEHPEVKDIVLETVDELKEPELADTFDYYYVPTFYVDDKKVHEGGIYKPEVEKLLRQIIE